MVFNATFNNISVKYVAVSFICRGNWSTWRKRVELLAFQSRSWILWLLQEGHIIYLGGKLTDKHCYLQYVTLLPKLSLIRPTRYFCMVIMWWTSQADALYTVKTSISSCGPCVRTLTKPRRLQIKLTATYLTEILLKVALNTITLTLTLQKYIYTPTVITILSDTPLFIIALVVA
jgi:hypothetical protein